MIYILNFFVELGLTSILEIDIDYDNSLKSKLNIYQKRKDSWILHFTGEN